ncbi:MAG TPA: hypothetical protein VHD31_02740 [Candidatus Paceibacterota bacterium]|nr:hypothetical protein [Candidatus Paceibacterota bacterium]
MSAIDHRYNLPVIKPASKFEKRMRIGLAVCLTAAAILIVADKIGERLQNEAADSVGASISSGINIVGSIMGNLP